MQRPRRQLREGVDQLLLWSQLMSLAVAVAAAAADGSPNAAWRYNDAHFTSAQYDKILGHSPGQEQLGPFQYQYVDYQPNCGAGGQPVCATNGTNYFYFENDCKLEAANMKMLFQYGTELEPTELERCQPQCDSIRCNSVYAPVCAAAEQDEGSQQGVTYANECEAQRRGCLTKQTRRVLNKGPCQEGRPKSKAKSRGKGRRRHGKQRRQKNSSSITTTTAIPPAAPASAKRVYFMLAHRPSSTTSTTTPAPMQFHQYLSHGNPDVSVSQAVNAYSVYNIPDVGLNYGAITDSSLSLYLPGIGTVTDTPPSTTTTTTTTTTSRPSTTTSTTALPTTALPATSTTVGEEIKFFYMPYGTTSTTTARASSSSSLGVEATSTAATIVDTIAGTTTGTTTGTTIASTTLPSQLVTSEVAHNASQVEAATSPGLEIVKPHPKPTVLKS